MKKAIIKLLVFAGTFFLSLIIISFFMNKGNTDMTAPMAPASLPSVAMVAEGMELNQMYGYTDSMETAGMREGITTLGEHRQVDALIHTYGQNILRVGYEVRSIDGSRLIENTTLTEISKNGSDWRISFRLKDLIEEGEEYSLIFVLELEDNREVRYYTRVIQADYSLGEKLAFIRDFSDATFEYDTFVAKEYNRKLETSSDTSNSSLASVSIHNTTKQVTWGELSVEQETEPQIRITEIAPQTASAVLTYMVSYPENQKTAYARVEEYYRVRLTADNLYLLDYERTAEQFLEETAGSFVNDKISLGISDPDIRMKESDGGTVVAFSHAGVLYSYNSADNSLARLFSFYDEGREDERTWNDNHDYEILQVDETGNVTFLVYGYMNRGRHEGQCGVQVCYYSSTLKVVEEMVFIPSVKAADILRADIENLAYVNGKNDLYLMLDGSIYHIGLENKENTIVVQGLSENSYRVSENSSMLAWQKESADTLVFMNLNSGEADEIKAGTGNVIRPLGFMGEDLIYGIAQKENVTEDALGDMQFLMHRLVIRDFNGEVLMTYEQEDVYITDCSIQENQINLERAQKNGTTVTAAEPDQILYSDELPASRNYVETAVTENLQTVVQIALKSQVDSKKVRILTPKEVLFEGSRDVELETAQRPERYYVYGRDGVVDILSDPAAAARLAYEQAGTVAAEDGSYLFKRDRLHTSNQIMAIQGSKPENGETSLAVCLRVLFKFEGLMRDTQHLLDSGKDVLTILEENLEGRRILNLQGCTLDMVLYYPDREIPVLAVLQDGSAVLITGFNEKNVVIMDPQTGTVYKKGMNDARTWFAENGNRFIAYW